MFGARMLVLAAAVAVLAAAGCGGGEEETTTTSADSGPETPERVAGLPPGWKLESNRVQGFALGAPPGWRSAGDCIGKGSPDPGAVTLLCSPDRLVSLSVSADRTNEALELPPADFAARTMEGLAADSYEGLEPGEPQAFKARYDGAAVEGTGEALASGVRQDVTVVVLRRDQIANFTAVIAANADKPTGPAVELAADALRTLRSQPVGAPPG